MASHPEADSDNSPQSHKPQSDEQFDMLRRKLEECLQREAKLRKTEQHFERLVETMNEGLAMQDADKRLTYINEAFCRMLGYTREELLNMRVEETLAPSHHRAYHDQIELRKQGADAPYESLFRRKDGSLMEVVVSPRPLFDESGQFIGSFAVITDVSAMHRVERQLRMEHRRLLDIIDFLPDATFVLDSQRQVIAWNKALEEMTGVPKEDMIGKGDYEYAIPFYGKRRPIVIDMLWRDDDEVHQQYDYVENSNGRVVVEKFVPSIYHGQGGYLWATASALYDEQGNMVGAIETIRDITNRKRNQQDLQRERDLLARIMETSPVGILLGDRKGVVTFANARAQEILGLPRSLIQGQACDSVWNPEQAESSLLPGEQQLFSRIDGRSETIYDRRLQIRTAAGQERTVSINHAPLYDADGDYDGAVTTFEDVSWRVESERALRQSEEDYRLLVENLSDLVVKVDPQGRIIFASPNYCETFGKSEEELIGNSFMPLVHEQDRPATEEAWNRVFDPPHKVDLEQRAMTRSGWRWFAWSDSAILDEQGKVEAIIGVGRDVTQHREAEDALRESQRRMATLLSNLPGMAYRCINDQQWTMVYVSHGSTDLTGYRPEQLQQNRDISYSELIEPEDRRLVWHDVQAAVAKQQPFNITYRLRRADGKVRWILEMGRAVEHAEGQNEVLEGFMTDVTDRVTAEDELRRSQQRYRDLFETMHDAFALLEAIDVDDPEKVDFRFLEVNPSFEQTFQVKAKALFGTTVRQFVPKIDERLMQTFAQVVKSGEATRFEFESPNYGLLLEVTAFRPQSGQLATLLVDVTDRKQAEKERDRLRQQLLQAQKMEAIGTLAGGVAHDFNNLLTGILGYADLMKFGAPEGSDVREAAEAIESAARKAAQLTSQLLGFARGGKYQDIAFNVHSQIQDVTNLLSRTFQKNISVELGLQALNPIITGDPTQIQQVILNLSVNARDAMPNGGKLELATDNVVLDDEYCSIHHGVKPGRYLMVRVSDTGQGIPKDIQARIFEPFFTTKEVGKGTGMGLAMVYGIVKNHGGSIQLYSEPGMGTTFRIYFPTAEAEEDMAMHAESPVVSGCGTILLVDDEEVVRASVSRMLETMGYKVLPAAGGKEAVEIFGQRKDEIVLVIIDMIMPEMSGLACLRRLKKIDPQVKAVLSSGYSMEADLKKARKEGFAEFVQKPFQMAHLSGVISSVIGECRPEDSPKEDAADD